MKLTRYEFTPDITKGEYYKLYEDYSTSVKKIPLLWKAKNDNIPTLEEILGCGKKKLKKLYLNYSTYAGEIEFECLSYTTETGDNIDVFDMEIEEEKMFYDIINNCFRGYIEQYLYRVMEMDEESEEGWHIGLAFDTAGFFNSPAVFLGYHLENYDPHEVIPKLTAYTEDSAYYELAQNAMELLNNSTEETVKIESKACSADDISTFFMGNDTVIVTENVNGDMYVIKAKCVQDIIDDWNNDCSFVPHNDARVYFACWNGKPISPYEYTDFVSLIAYLKELLK